MLALVYNKEHFALKCGEGESNPPYAPLGRFRLLFHIHLSFGLELSLTRDSAGA